MRIRQAAVSDATSIQAIYAPYVSETAISFEEKPPNEAEIAQRIEAILPSYPYLVAELEGRVVGFAYASPHRTRAAYKTSVDVAVYVAPDAHKQGVGRQLYYQLLPAAAEYGYHAAYAGIALPNEPSIRLHEAMGFQTVGIYREVGRKFDRWLDVGWWQRLL